MSIIVDSSEYYYDTDYHDDHSTDYNAMYKEYTQTRSGHRNRGVEDKYNYRYYNKPSMDIYQKVSI